MKKRTLAVYTLLIVTTCSQAFALPIRGKTPSGTDAFTSIAVDPVRERDGVKIASKSNFSIDASGKKHRLGLINGDVYVPILLAIKNGRRVIPVKKARAKRYLRTKWYCWLNSLTT